MQTQIWLQFDFLKSTFPDRLFPIDFRKLTCFQKSIQWNFSLIWSSLAKYYWKIELNVLEDSWIELVLFNNLVRNWWSTIYKTFYDYHFIFCLLHTTSKGRTIIIFRKKQTTKLLEYLTRYFISKFYLKLVIYTYTRFHFAKKIPQ